MICSLWVYYCLLSQYITITHEIFSKLMELSIKFAGLGTKNYEPYQHSHVQ
jgi:hypothetical protein